MQEIAADVVLDDWASYHHLEGRSVDVHSALFHLFEPTSDALTSDEPPRKKRKTAVHAHGLGNSAEDHYVNVAHYKITLGTEKASGAADLGVTPPALPVRLSLGQEHQRHWPSAGGAKRSANGTFPLNISLRHKASRTISLLLKHDQEYHILQQVLQDICSLDHATPPGPSLRPRDVALADCYLEPPSSADPRFVLNVRVKWRIGLLGYQFKADWLRKAAGRYLPGSTSRSSGYWSPRDFYDNVHLPSKNEPIPEALQARGLNTELYIFQKRAVKWLLRRERVSIDQTGSLKPIQDEGLQRITSFAAHHDADGQLYYASRLLEQVRTGEELPRDEDLSGGILASEMGLGKTVEMIALMLLHPRLGELVKKEVDPYTATEVHPSRGTLIITPPNILSQWQSELERHAPGLKVHHYEGLQKSKESERQIRKLLQEQNVVLTTYAVLAREIHYAREPPKRNMRHAKAYEARRSPLVSIHWWRVCLDEAQMVESGVSNAATVARLIPRQHSWAVSGTPLKKDIKDLQGLFIFLRLEPYCNVDVFNRLLLGYRDLMTKLIGSIALRNTKHDLRDELVLPPQKRVTITCSFTPVEAQRYNDLFRQMCDEVGVDTAGAPITDDWNPEHPGTIERMRGWLSRLRSTCLHAEIGGRNRRALGTKGGPLRTVDEVLEVMIDQNETAMRTQQRAVLDQQIMRGQLYSFGRDPTTALATFEQALSEATIAVDEARGQLELEKEKQARAIGETGNNTKDEQDASSDDNDENDDDRKDRLVLLRNRLRLALELQHVCLFFKATAMFQIKDNAELTEPDSEAWQDLDRQESECYDQAKGIRRELLSNVSKRTTRLMNQVRKVQSSSSVAFSVIRPIEHYRGLESRKIMEKTEMLRRTMNEYAEHLTKWRSRLVELILQNLLDQEDDTLTGEEYEASTKAQDEQYCLLEALRAGLADRHCAMTGQINILLNHEMKQALKLATDGKRDEPEDKGPAPELFQEILRTRQSLIPPENLQVATAQNMAKPSVSIRGIMTEIRSLVTAIQWQASERSKAEAAILEQELQNLQSLFNNQMKEVGRFEKDLDVFRSTMNQRLEFYKQLQQISDQVAPLQEEATDEVDQQRLVLVQERENAATDRLTTLKTKQRFLLHLRDQSSGKAESQLCVICQDHFEIGQLTSCGHTYCRDCLSIWWNQHRSCPMCKAPLRSQKDFFQVTYKPNELKAKEEAYSPTSSDDQSSGTGSPTKPSIYSSVSDSTMKDIKNIDLPSTVSYGVKVDTICRHLLYLREHDPGSKSIIFSQYRDFLNVLGRAFASHKIGYADIMAKSGIRDFRDDPGKECFLLHAKADSSGLNLVNATHVFLCEPLINPAIELQAIARVHRIGQRRPTTVWMYIVQDTVEEAIHEISIQRRLADLKRDAASSDEPSRATTPSPAIFDESKLETANSRELQSAPISKLLTSGQSGGELVAKDDLWSCLFSKPNRGADLSLTRSPGPAGNEMGAFLRAKAAEARRNDV